MLACSESPRTFLQILTSAIFLDLETADVKEDEIAALSKNLYNFANMEIIAGFGQYLLIVILVCTN